MEVLSHSVPLPVDQQPLVSVVTPCLNAAQFIERTIDSVMAQDYPHIEYVVMDGGSTDATLAVLERYGSRLRYFSGRDKGAADAINRGFLQSRGSIFAWLNADDVYLPGAVSAAVRCLRNAPDAAVVYGEGVWIDEKGSELGAYPTVSPYDPAALERECCLCQPAAFIRREDFERAGMLDPSLQSAFDYDLWIRLSRAGLFVATPEILAGSRMHVDNKSLGQRRQVFEESILVLRRRFGYVPARWVYGYLSFLRDGRDQYFETLRHSAPVYLASLAVGSYYNHQRLWRYWREWSSLLTVSNFKRVYASGQKADPVYSSRR
jgi:glycosyltransferase involved in cell wall biosynthesis